MNGKSSDYEHTMNSNVVELLYQMEAIAKTTIKLLRLAKENGDRAAYARMHDAYLSMLLTQKLYAKLEFTDNGGSNHDR